VKIVGLRRARRDGWFQATAPGPALQRAWSDLVIGKGSDEGERNAVSVIGYARL